MQEPSKLLWLFGSFILIPRQYLQPQPCHTVLVLEKVEIKGDRNFSAQGTSAVSKPRNAEV